MDSVLYERHYRLEHQHWWFVGRRHLVLQELQRGMGHNSGPILDVGCGTGGMLAYLQQIDTALGIDSAPEAALACKERGVPFVLGGGSDLPFADAAFGAVTALDVIEHVGDDAGIVRELYRVLRPGGVLLVTVPAYQFLWSQHDEANHHRRRYQRGNLRGLIAGVGFDIVKASYYNTLLFPLAVARKALMRTRTGEAPATHLDEIPGPLNTLLKRVLIGEGPLIRRWDFPYGASLICVARRPAGPVPARVRAALNGVAAEA